MRRFAFAVVAATVIGGSLVGYQATEACAQELPPGVTIPAQGAFAPPAGLGAFQAMTFVVDIAAGAAFPLHSHPGRSEVIILQGELTQHHPNGEQQIYHAGDTFMEEPGEVHSVTNTGSDTVRLVWTLLLPQGAEPIMAQGK